MPARHPPNTRIRSAPAIEPTMNDEPIKTNNLPGVSRRRMVQGLGFAALPLGA